MYVPKKAMKINWANKSQEKKFKYEAGYFVPTRQTPFFLKCEDNFAKKRKLRSFHLTIRIALAGERGEVKVLSLHSKQKIKNIHIYLLRRRTTIGIHK